MTQARTPYSYIALGAGGSNQDSTVAKATPTNLGGAVLCNISAAVKFVKFYNQIALPTFAKTPIWRVELQINQTLAVSFGPGMAFSAGVSFRLTGAEADNDQTNVTAGDIIVNLWWL